MRRRILITAAASVGLLLIASISFAAWLSLKETADSRFAASSSSLRIDIGDAETTALFSVSDMAPGDTAEACFRVKINLVGTSPATVAHLYSGGVTGTGLDAHLDISILREDPVRQSQALPGIIACTEVSGITTNLTAVFLENLGTYASSTDSYALGDSLGSLDAEMVNTVDIKVILRLPTDAPASAGGLTASTSWILEDQ